MPLPRSIRVGSDQTFTAAIKSVVAAGPPDGAKRPVEQGDGAGPFERKYQACLFQRQVATNG